jgi:DNA helicase-2/ATP-dependent DNA helicase PcrA
VNAITDALGFDPESDHDSDDEITRQADLGRLRALAAEFQLAHDHGLVAAFVEELGRRFSTEHSGRGVNLLTYHRAKGLEFDAVFLPRLLDGELPFRSGRAKAEPDEERRLLYVGITRARTYLFLTWATDAKTKPSPFLDELGVRTPSAPKRAAPSRIRLPKAGGPVLDRLKAWRKSRAKADGVPAYVIFHDKTLEEIADLLPKDWADLASISGVGPTKLERYGDEVLAVVATV